MNELNNQNKNSNSENLTVENQQNQEAVNAE